MKSYSIYDPYLDVSKELTAGAVLYVGRGDLEEMILEAGSDVTTVDSTVVSRRHVALDLISEQPKIRNHGSHNPATLNGKLIPYSGWVDINDGNVIRMGPWVVRFDVKEEKIL